MTIRVIGLDCATVDNRIGVALGEVVDDAVRVSEARCCRAGETAVAVVTRWLKLGGATQTLLAIDAPLGWPRELSSSLLDHRAGKHILTEPNAMFRRETDRVVHRELKKLPLDVGADRIARTAHFALEILRQVRSDVQADIPLAWSPSFSGIAAIEVYPAATLLARRLPAKRYKKPSQTLERARILAELRAYVALPADHGFMLESADALDAAVCVVAGADFLRGKCWPPVDVARAQQEGWIWFPRTSDAG